MPPTIFRRVMVVLSALLLAAVTIGNAEASPLRAPHARPASVSVACVPGPTTLCLNNQRFKVDVRWTDFQGNTGSGQAISLTGDTGYFWFFSASNVELVVKVVDGRALNSYFWVFFGALSNVAYTMNVTDTLTGSVKTYVNPSGTFGSVGDTAAFLSSGAATVTRAVTTDVGKGGAEAASRELALRESLLPAGAAAPARTRDAARRSQTAAVTGAGTCLATNTSLCLNDGRFRVEVAWKDFAGNTGVGTAVGLTGDTGYFWFFSSNNVELTVKALDARVLNGRFWLFYGALSNVEYQMTVTDTLTGVVNTYSNPSGRFASVGDTSGFAAGYSVAAQLDASHSASSVIPASGGSLSVTGADGTVFTLTVPAGALLSDEEITMTPVSAIDRLPLSGGLAAAVELSPEGLQLFQPATLVIAPPVPIAAGDETTFAWRGTGDEFFLFPPEPLATSSITLSVFHLSGYGAGRGSGADQTAQQGRPPESPDDQLEQSLQGPAADERKSVRNGGTLGKAAATRSLRPAGKSAAQILATKTLSDYFLHVLEPALPTSCTDDWKSFLVMLANFKQRVAALTGPDIDLLNAAATYRDAVYTLLADCYDKAYDTCKAQKDPTQGEEMSKYWFALISSQSGRTVDVSKIPKCLTFELTFDSFVQEPPIPNLAGATLTFRHQVNAVVPMVTFSNLPGGNDQNIIEVLKYIPSWIYDPGDSKCGFTATGTDTVFIVQSIFLDINVFAGNGSPPNPLSLRYDPGHPDFSFTLTCGAAPPITITTPRWRQFYEAFHGNEYVNPYFDAKDWSKTAGGDKYAFKTYDNGPSPATEHTEIVLKHTPQ